MYSERFPSEHNPGFNNATPPQKRSPVVLILILCIVLVVLIFAGILAVTYLNRSEADEESLRSNDSLISEVEPEPETAPQFRTETFRYVSQWPNGFPTDSDIYKTYSGQPSTGGDTSTRKHVGYIYWHWCRGELIDGPINRTTGLVMTDRHDTFHAYFSEVRPDLSGDQIYDGSRWVINPTPDGTYHHPHFCCTDTYWFYVIDVWEQDFLIEVQ